MPVWAANSAMKAEPTRTVDAFHRGRFQVVQPLGTGHRAGLDAMLLAACVPDGFAGVLADLGAGCGAAGLAVLSRCPDAQALLVENAPEMAALARDSLALPGNEALRPRAQVIEADVRLEGGRRRDAGLADHSADQIIMNPPFNAPGDRASPDRLKRAAHVGAEGDLVAWVRTAAAMARPAGRLALILRAEAVGEAMTALSGRFGGLEARFVHPRADAPAIRCLLRGRKGSRARLKVLPPLILHEDGTGRLAADADSAINGTQVLFPD